MKAFYSFSLCLLALLIVLLSSCSSAKKDSSTASSPQPPPAFHVDSATAGSISGGIRYIGKRPAPKTIDMSEDPACVAAHHGKAVDESLVVSPKGGLANAFIYVKSGLEGKRFDPPSTPAVIDQRGCWFRPRIIGIQVNQLLNVINSDPVTHNIHPMAEVNREWNHSQGAGDPPLARRFIKPEVMIRVKCNIHSWMHAYIGVLDHPYFAVSRDDGSFTLPNLPPGDYAIEVWHETLGTQEQKVTVAPHSDAPVNVIFKAH